MRKDNMLTWQYGLRAVLFHDGALMGTRHLYMYLLCDGPDDTKQWWKIKEHEATKVSTDKLWDDSSANGTGRMGGCRGRCHGYIHGWRTLLCKPISLGYWASRLIVSFYTIENHPA